MPTLGSIVMPSSPGSTSLTEPRCPASVSSASVVQR